MTDRNVPDIDDIVGYDTSTDWFDPSVVCADCYVDDDDDGAVPLARGEEWWNHDGRCHRCGSDVDLTVVYDDGLRGAAKDAGQ